jgi:hypothetical protein
MEKRIVLKKYDKAFLTGCDEGHAWMIPWFVENYKRHNSAPLIFANFGVSQSTLKYIEKHFHAIIDMSKTKERGWFKKPRAMLNSPSVKTVWIDTDCHICDNIESIFGMLKPNKLSMVEDKPWTKRRGEIWHNSGVVGFIDKPMILHQWCQEVHNNPSVGDQEVLHSMLNPITKLTHIEDLPNEYNVLRLQVELDGYTGKKKIVHWTGAKGKDKIRSMMNA